MVIRYTVTLNDLKAYQESIRAAIPDFIKIRCVQSIGGPLFLLSLLWLLTNFDHGWWPTLIGLLPAALLGLYLWRESPGLWRRRNLDVLHQAGKLDGHLGNHCMEIREDGVIERNAAGEHLSYWNQIENIYSTAEHTFFVTKTRLGYTLPKSSITEGNYQTFMDTAIAIWKKHVG